MTLNAALDLAETKLRPALLVLAAGMGSRFGGLKQIDPVGPHGEAILDYSIFDALRAGFGKVVFVIRKEIDEAFKATVGARLEGRVAVDYAYQEIAHLPPGFTAPPGRAKPWGTAHAIWSASGAVKEPFAVINADDWYGRGSYSILASHLQSGAPEYAMAGFALRNTLSEFGPVARGICQVDDSGLLKSVVEMTSIERDGQLAKNTASDGSITRLSGDELVSMNIWGFTPSIFDQLESRLLQFLEADGASMKAELYIPTAVNQLIQSGEARVRVLPSNEPWFGFTYREDQPRVVEAVRNLIASGYYPQRLWA